MNAADPLYMARALELARQGLYSTHPNPRVGCVLVKDGQVVGEGWHVRAGEPHAEVHALRQAGENARGATAYVTLEPCSHFGRTPPCADALVGAGVARVVAAMQDPNPEVAGRGLLRLMQAGIAVQSGVLEAEARELNIGFIKRMEHGLPFVRVKLAMSLDGRTAMASGESQWITGPAARSAVQRLRARSSVVLSGADTLLADDARLNVRPDELGLNAELTALAAARQPLRVLVDGRLRVPLESAFYQAGPALRATCAAASARERFQDAGHELRRAEVPRLQRPSFARLAAGADGRCGAVADRRHPRGGRRLAGHRAAPSAGRLNFAARRRGGRCTSGATVVKRHTAISMAVTFSGRGESPHRR